jgi:dTDP-4-dehydrorhamnose reductase
LEANVKGNVGEPVVVVGSEGMLGTDLMVLLEKLGIHAVGLDIDEIDIRDSSSVAVKLKDLAPRAVMNLAALTDVDGCETRIEEAYAVNGQGPGNLAVVCREIGCPLIHISTDYVFGGRGISGPPYGEDCGRDKSRPYKKSVHIEDNSTYEKSPYLEDDPISPVGVYGKSKAVGEQRVREALPDNHLIVRTQWLYGLHGKNFVRTILGIAEKQNVIRVVNDQAGSPTYTVDLAYGIILLWRANAGGTVHFANSGIVTWFDFACEIISQAGLKGVRVEPISTAELARPAPRPAYSALDTSRFARETRMVPRPWRDGLADYLAGRDAGSTLLAEDIPKD